MRYLATRWWPLIAWTVFLWLSRVRNVLADDDLDGVGRSIRLAIVVVFLALAAIAATQLSGRLGPRWRAVPAALAVWTVGFWTVRGTGILLDDHGASFKAIHTGLWLVSVVLAVVALVYGTTRATTDAAERATAS